MRWDGKRVRNRIIGNGRLKLFSVAFACGLWLFVNYAERDTEKTLVVPVEFNNLPAQLVIDGKRDEYVDLRLRGPRSLLGQLNSKKIRLDLREVRAGMASFRITADMLNLPRGVRLIRINPAQVNLSIEQVIKRTIPVQLELTGKPPRGYLVNETEITPDKIEVSGPAPRVEKLQVIQTDTVDVNGLTQPLMREITLRGPAEGSIAYHRDRVTVRIGIEEVISTREFRNVPIAVKNATARTVLRPSRATVIVRGPQRVIEQLQLNEEALFADAKGHEDGAITVPVTVLVPLGVEIVTQEPEHATLQLMGDNKKKPVKPGTERKL